MPPHALLFLRQRSSRSYELFAEVLISIIAVNDLPLSRYPLLTTLARRRQVFPHRFVLSGSMVVEQLDPSVTSSPTAASN